MRIRTIKPEFWSHEEMCQLSEFTRLMAIALLNYADDDGYFMANPRLVRCALFPFEDDSKKILGSIQDLSRAGYLEIGKDSEGRDVGRIVNFLLHQRIDKPKPSKIKGNFTIQDESKTNPRLIQDASKEEGKGKEQGKGMEMDLSCPISSDDSEILKLIWDRVPRVSRERSSKKQLAEQWRKIKPKPNKETLQTALSAWNETAKWKEGYAEGVHIWVQNRQWENIPEPEKKKNESLHPFLR